ncbi:retrovirus-related pol polyprotein from transposon TNT 1-94, partial [Tanacetum coccineum]
MPEPVIPNNPEHDNASSENSTSEHHSHTHTALTTNQAPPVRRSSRSSTQPAWLKDFVTSKHKAGMTATNNPKTKHTIYPLFQAEDFEQYPAEYIASLANVLAIPEPLDKYKARLVIRGFSQKEGLDYKHTFSPVAKAATVRVLIAIATAKVWPLHQLDVNNAFLHGYVDEEIYMKPLEGYNKAAPEICDTKRALDEKFSIKDLGLERYFLGIELCNTAQGTYLHQRKYILDLLQDAGLTSAKPTSFPLPQNLKLALNKGNPINDAESTE